MKRIFLVIVSALLLVPSLTSISAQGNNKRDWKDRWKAEKIAFLTDAMDLTSSEAETFWPVYNKAEMEKDNSFRNVIDTYKSLENAIDSNKDDAEITRLLNKYLDAQQNGKDIDKKYANEYRKILSSKKVAKLYIGEEQFRRQQIHRLNKDNGNECK